MAEFNALMRDARIVPPVEPNALLQSPTQADAWSHNAQAATDWMERQRQISRDQGLWTGGSVLEGGHPTQAGALDAVRQASMNLLMSTSAPGFKAYHGSPHSFDRFDSSKIGTGEGAQAYGHGMYFAENEGVAKGYRDNLTVKPITPELKAAQDAYNKAYWDVPTGGTQAEFDAAIARRDAAQAEMRRVQTEWEAQPGPKGHMYEVNVAADPEHFLHWDKPLSEQHPVVRDALDKVGVDTGSRWVKSNEPNAFNREGARGTEATIRQIDRYGDGNLEWQATYDTLDGRGVQRFPTQEEARAWIDKEAPINAGRGAEVYQRLRSQYSDAEVTQILREAGIPGIRYLDQGSRGAGEGSHNAVVFDDATIEILRKYGIAGLIAGGGAAAAGSQQPQ